jgi:hypothetical protein
VALYRGISLEITQEVSRLSWRNAKMAVYRGALYRDLFIIVMYTFQYIPFSVI